MKSRIQSGADDSGVPSLLQNSAGYGRRGKGEHRRSGDAELRCGGSADGGRQAVGMGEERKLDLEQLQPRS